MKTLAEVMKEYSRLHCCCPACGKLTIEQTCMAFIPYDLGLYEDRNFANCYSCKWEGRVYDLVPECR